MFSGIKLLTSIGMRPTHGLLLVCLMTAKLVAAVGRCRYLHARYSYVFISSLELPNILS